MRLEAEGPEIWGLMQGAPLAHFQKIPAGPLNARRFFGLLSNTEVKILLKHWMRSRNTS